jgi:hypothetical protein
MSTPAPTIEQRILAIEQQVIPILAKQVPKGAISTKLAGIITTVVLVATYTLSMPLPEWAHFGLTAVVTGITAFETAENT